MREIRWLPLVRHIFPQGGIRASLLGAFIILTFLPLVILGLVLHWQVAAHMTAEIVARLSAVSTLEVQEVEGFFTEQAGDLGSMLLTGAAQDNALYLLQHSPSAEGYRLAEGATYDLFQSVLRQNEDVAELSLIDRGGIVVLSTEPQRRGALQADQTYFLEGLQERYVSPLLLDPESGETVIYLAEPVHDLSVGINRGVLVARLSSQAIDEILSERIGLGETGETYLVIPPGQLITPLRHVTSSPPDLNTHGIREALAGHEGFGLYTNYAGTEVIGYYRWLPEVGAGLLAEQARSEAFAALDRLTRFALVVVSIGVVVTISVILMLTQRITRPIIQLAAVAEAITAGNWETPIPSGARGEVGTLAEAFQTMAGRLRELIETLEQRMAGRKRAEEALRRAHDELEIRVQERTAELARANEALQAEITERKRAEEALKVSREYARNIIDSSLDMIIAVDMDRHIVEFNRAAQETFGYRREEVLGVHVDILYADPQEGLAVHKTTIEKGQCVREIFDRRKNGEVFPCFLSASVVHDARGELVGVMGVSRDITERKRAEEALRTAHDELKRRVEELTFLNRVGRAVTSSLDLEQILTTVMEETTLMLGTEAGSISLLNEESSELIFQAAVGPRSEEVKGLRVPLGQGIAGWVAREGQRLLVPDVREDPRFYSGIDEATGFVTRSLLAVPMKVKGKVIGVIEAVNKTEGNFSQADVALLSSMVQSAAIAIENARLFKDLQDQVEELKRTQAQLLQVQKMESIGQLAAGIAHDFNNLLTPITGFTELLLLKAPDSSQQHEYLRQIKVAAERAASLTRQLRLFTRQQGGERRSVQLNSVIEETRDLLERSIPKEIAIELRLESELWAVEADPSQISQVLMNLCVNARDAMPDGGTLTLETRNVTLDEEYARTVLEAQPGRYVCLSVLDTGCGMSPGVQARLFEPFFTTKEVGRGTGLGLAVVYGIVRGHGGFIQVYSEEGQGSTFHVHLPATELAVEEREVEVSELSTGTETILLVDDEEAVRALGQRVLELCGYTVLMAEDGVQALEVHQTHQGEIDLVVLDVIMPQMSGQECLRRLRELDPQVKILISTGHTANSTAQKLVAEGALGVVEKPFLLQDFAVAVRVALDTS